MLQTKWLILSYFIVTEVTQLEDPRLEWLSIQEAMLRDYLHTAQEALEVSILTRCIHFIWKKPKVLIYGNYVAEDPHHPYLVN